MRKGVFKSLTALVMTLIILVVPVAAYELPGNVQYAFITEMAEYINENYKFEITKEELLGAAFREKLINTDASFDEMIAAMMEVLDENSSYLTEDEYQRMMEHSILGEFSGIGVTITSKNKRVIVVSPIIGSPAHTAGVQTNDIIVGIDGEDVSESSMEYVRNLIVGKVGTSVRVSVLRGDRVIDFDITRAEIQDVPVTYEILDDIGYIQITGFNNNTVDATEVALAEFDAAGINRIALDLRYNSGGELNAAIGLCGLFVPKGVVARIEFKNHKNNELYYSKLEKPRYKLAVLINEGSASASELFTGALQDTGVAKVFGTKSYGKGTVQQIMPLVTGGSIRLTIAEYLTAGGRRINQKGIIPDVYLENTERIPDTTHFVDIDFSEELLSGVSSRGVLALEQRMVVLGYMDEADQVFDDVTENALKTYQAYRGLSATGIADVYTLIDINNIDYGVPFQVDDQYKAVIEYLRSLE